MTNKLSNRVIPSWEEIAKFKQPLTDGEEFLLDYLDKNLPKDQNWNDNSGLKNYNGWLIFVQPYLNGTRPDIIVFNPLVGLQIIEVKDWNLDHYSWEGDEFCVSDSKGKYYIKSPLKQVDHYKKILIGQLAPIIGDSIDKNRRSYGMVKTSVYFHKASSEEIDDLFHDHILDNTYSAFGFELLKKDENISKIIPDSKYTKSLYWKSNWNDDLIFWLKPPFHSIEQGIPLKLSKEQEKFAFPKSGHQRIRGVAGSGKTNILAYRAAHLASLGFNVLILTYNITLWHYIRDMIQRAPFNFSWDKFKLSHFHGFCSDILNEFDKKWPEGAGEDLFKKIITDEVSLAIQNNEFQKYDAVLIDEGQDYYFEWYELLQEFLTERDEVVVVCDKKQNVYQRDMDWLDKRKSGRDKFGDWIELKTVFRLPPKIAEITNLFSEEFDLSQEVKYESVENLQLFEVERYVWQNIKPSDWLRKVKTAFIRLKAEEQNPSDIIIMVPDKYHGKECISVFNKMNIETNNVFDGDENLTKNKRSFWMGDSRLKISTIHSFKGWELKNVIIYIPKKTNWADSEMDSLIYTAMTRTRQHLIVFNANPRYIEFGEKLPHSWDYFNTNINNEK